MDDGRRDDATEAVWAAVDRAVVRARRHRRLNRDDGDEFGQAVRAFIAERLDPLLAACRQRASLDAYVDAIVGHCVVNWLRTRNAARRRTAGIDVTGESGAAARTREFASSAPSPEQLFSQQEAARVAARARRRVLEILDRLPAYDRALLVARFSKAQTVSAIATERRKTRKAVSHHMTRLLASIRRRLAAEGIDGRLVLEALADSGREVEFARPPSSLPASQPPSLDMIPPCPVPATAPSSTTPTSGTSQTSTRIGSRGTGRVPN